MMFRKVKINIMGKKKKKEILTFDFETMEKVGCATCSRSPSCNCDVLLIDNWIKREGK